MKIHNVVQGSPEWLALRAKFFTASEAPAMMGCSPYMTRTDLLKQKHTGMVSEVSPEQQERFNRGHAAEAAFRPIAESMIGDDLYPCTGSIELDGLPLLASFDGLPMDRKIVFEHKLLNALLVEMLIQHLEPGPAYYWQLEQELLVSGADEVLFSTSDGTEESATTCRYKSKPERRAQLIAGWKQFSIDLAAFVPPEAVDQKPTGHAPETLPALRIEVTGMVTASNLAEFKQTALAVFGGINRTLTTDADFANAEQTVKWCGDVEERLAAAKQHALSQTASIDDLFRTIDDISAEARRVRLDLDKLVKARKEAIRGEIVADGVAKLREHIDGLNTRLGKPYMSVIPADFGGVIKGKRTVDSLRDAVSTELARAKIAANEIADRLQKNLDYLRHNAADFKFLFADTTQIIQKAPDDLQALVQNRITEHKADEERRMEVEREKIRKEEQDKLAREQRATQEAEDALVSSIWNNARRIEFDSAPYIQKAIGMFETGAKDWENDPRPRVAAAVAEARSEMKAKLVAAQEREQAAAATKPAEQAAPVAVQPAATPAPAANVVPMRAAPTPAPAAPSTPPTLKLGQIGERLGFSLTGDFLKSIGFEPAARDKSALLFHEATFTHICAALIDHIGQVQAKQAA